MIRPALQPAYAPRNLLNADRIKHDIIARSQARGDEPAVARWLHNHFYRHLVANFEPATPILSLDDARAVQATGALPAWLLRRFDTSARAAGEGDAALVWIDPQAPQILALETLLLEFLQSRTGTALEGKLERINCPQALRLHQQEHARMALRVGRGWRTSQPLALGLVCEVDGHRLQELLADSPLLRAEMAYESYVMRHCLGQFATHQSLSGGYGEHYAKAIESGSMRVFSLRDAQGQPHLTLSLNVRADGVLTVEQIKGKQNRPPVERYIPVLLECLNRLPTDEHAAPDCVAIGVVRTATGWTRIEAVTDATEQVHLVALYPQLFSRLKKTAPMVEWLVAAREPQLLVEIEPRAASVRYALRHLFNEPADDGPGYATEGVVWPGMSACEAERILAWHGHRE